MTLLRNTVKAIFGSYPKRQHDFYEFISLLASDLRANAQERTARAYITMAASISKYQNRDSLYIDDITADFVRHYESHLKREGLRPNTISFYMRNLRAVLNKARKMRLIDPSREFYFSDVYTGVDKTEKRAIKKEVITRISDMDLATHKSLQMAQDLFLFSFFTRGMSFIDMAFLKKSDIRNGIIRYRRNKTGQQLEIKVVSEAQQIITRYKDQTVSSPYALPIIARPGIDERKQYESALRTHNNRLRKISAMVNIKNNITSYVARHSWATIAKEKNIPISVISEGLGHNSQQTTMIYLASFDNSVLHKANLKVISM